METLTKLCDSVDLREYAACIVHPLIRVIDTSPELRGVAMNTLTAIVTQMGKNFTIFIPAVFKVCGTNLLASDENYIFIARKITIIVLREYSV